MTETADAKYAAHIQAEYDREHATICADEAAAKRLVEDMALEDEFEAATQQVDDKKMAKKLEREEKALEYQARMAKAA